MAEYVWRHTYFLDSNNYHHNNWGEGGGGQLKISIQWPQIFPTTSLKVNFIFPLWDKADLRLEVSNAHTNAHTHALRRMHGSPLFEQPVRDQIFDVRDGEVDLRSRLKRTLAQTKNIELLSLRDVLVAKPLPSSEWPWFPPRHSRSCCQGCPRLQSFRDTDCPKSPRSKRPSKLQV